MTKVTIEKKNIKEDIIIDPYIPLKVKFGNLYSWEDPTKYLRFGDLKYSMLDIGYSEETGIIQSIALVGAKEIYINKEQNFEVEHCEEGLIVFDSKSNLEDKQCRNIMSELVVSTSTVTNNVVLSVSDDEISKFVENGRVKFGLNKLDELCCIIVNALSVEAMDKLNWCLEYMM